jgi:TetR/AcrR family transcriptional regulator
VVKSDQNTETRILEAAKVVFHKKGFDGARMQEIADEAGINKALLHYYFRSKENLFNAVFREAFRDFFRRILGILGSDKPVSEKIPFIFNDYITFLQQNSYIPWFILNSLHQNPESITSIFEDTGFHPQMIIESLEQSMKRENLEVTDARQMIVNVIGLSVFPIIAKPMLIKVFGMTPEEFDGFIEVRKKELPEFFMNAIRKK